MQPINSYSNVHSIQPIATVNGTYSNTYSANGMPITSQANFVDQSSNIYKRNNNEQLN